MSEFGGGLGPYAPPYPTIIRYATPQPEYVLLLRKGIEKYNNGIVYSAEGGVYPKRILNVVREITEKEIGKSKSEFLSSVYPDLVA